MTEQKHTQEKWEESTGAPDFKTNWPEELGYLKPHDKSRAVACVNAMQGIDDVEVFMKKIKNQLKAREDAMRVREKVSSLWEGRYHQAAKALRKYDKKFFFNHDCCMTDNPSKEAEEALFPTTKEPDNA